MQIPISRRGGAGGTSLNFTVVGGTTQPKNPKENTIWINTDQEITGWSFSVEQPVEAQEGDVWISTGLAGHIRYNALDKNVIEIRIKSAFQYIGGAWSAFDAYFYQNDAWVSIKQYFFSSGIGAIVSFSGYKGTNSGYTIGTDTITLWVNSGATSGDISNIFTEEKQRIEEGATLVFDAKCTTQASAGATSAWAKRVGIYKSKNGSAGGSDNMIAGALLNADSIRKEYKVPITESGDYYISCCGVGSVTIYNIYIE